MHDWHEQNCIHQIGLQLVSGHLIGTLNQIHVDQFEHVSIS